SVAYAGDEKAARTARNGKSGSRARLRTAAHLIRAMLALRSEVPSDGGQASVPGRDGPSASPAAVQNHATPDRSAAPAVPASPRSVVQPPGQPVDPCKTPDPGESENKGGASPTQLVVGESGQRDRPHRWDAPRGR